MDRIASPTNERIDGHRAILIALAGYFVVAASTILLTTNGRNHATVWPADAIILALLLHSARREWLSILIAGWIANLMANGMTRGWAAGIVLYGAINMGQVLIAALLLERSGARRNLIEDTRASGRFLLYAGLVAPSLGAAAGSAVSMFTYGQPFGPSFLRWFAGGALGLLIVTPFLQALLDRGYRQSFARKTRGAWFEWFALVTLHGLITALVFAQSRVPLLFLPLSTLLLLSFRLGRMGTFIGVIIVTMAGAIASQMGVGPMTLMHRGPVFEAFYFQVYIGLILCTALPVAAAVASRAEALTELADHRLALQQILKHSPEGILCFDEAGTCRWADGRLEDFTGLGPAAFVGHTIEEISARVSPELLRLSGDASRDGEVPLTRDFSAALTPNRTLEASIGVVRQDGEVTGMVITLRDISLRKSRELAISVQAETDDLTGVLNRKGFRARLAAVVERPSGDFTLAMIDVDRFKSINDTFGHAIGDRVLAAVAERLNEGSRGGDLVFRLGGDEFAILFQCDVGRAHAICDRIAESLRRIPILTSGEVRVSASISCGIAQLLPGMTRGELYEAADNALYEVKRSGRDGVRAVA